jgi:hypothetical protein
MITGKEMNRWKQREKKIFREIDPWEFTQLSARDLSYEFKYKESNQ